MSNARPQRNLGLFGLVILVLLLISEIFAAGADRNRQQVVHELDRELIAARFASAIPEQWGEVVAGVKTRLATNEKLLALTMDACGSPKGMGFDAELLAYLEREKIPATLFVSARWIEPNREAFDRLSANPLFEIANHGYQHKPASVTGRSVYGLDGTRNVTELIGEIELGAVKIATITGQRPRFYRSGTAYYDEVAVQVAEALGQQVVGFSILGDKGATFTQDEVKKALLKAVPGDIIVVHMNHPESETRAGLMEAIPELKKRGFRFVRLSEQSLR